MTYRARGFTLVELAMVLFIVALLLGGLLVPLASQLEGRKRLEAQEQLERIKEALIGFAIVNGRLPCFTTEVNPMLDTYGTEDAVCNPTGLHFNGIEACTDVDGDGVPDVPCDGILPWKTLGLASGMDPWGIQRTSEGDRWIGYWRYRIDQNFTNVPCNGDAGISMSRDPVFCDQLNVVNSAGAALVSDTELPVAIIYSTGANMRENGHNASYEPSSAQDPTYQGGEVSGDFDDILTWLSRPLLFSRMVQAGRLP
jgi:prepilin-type N-terminal cleavage/methylation domain-containing protein